MAHEQEERIIEQTIDDGACEREAHAACSGLIIKRRRLVDQIMMKLGESGAAILCAPPGFGRTAVLLQCVSHAQNDAVRRETHLIDAGRLDTERLVERLAALAREHGAQRLAVGLPRNMDGSEGESAQNARDIGALLEAATGLPVEFVDERGTTITAHGYLNETNTRGKRRKAVVDAVAATVILQNYLDARRLRRSQE